jgi:hypothetical protein
LPEDHQHAEHEQRGGERDHPPDFAAPEEGEQGAGDAEPGRQISKEASNRFHDAGPQSAWGYAREDE